MLLRHWPDPVLSATAVPVVDFGPIAALADEMGQAMENFSGVGLAANQVGRPEALFVARDLEGGGVHVVVNPVVVATRGWERDEEGCLSLPGKVFTMARPTFVVVEGCDARGEARRWEVSGYQARIFCHELDHLGGHLIGPGPDRPVAPRRAAA